MKTQNIKSVIIAIFFLLGISTTMEAQTNYESLFGNSQTSWNILSGNLDIEYTDSIAISKDTVIGGQAYKKLEIYRLGWGGSPNTYGKLSQTGVIREDQQTGKAWVSLLPNVNEKLIMDLGLAVGDMFYVDGGTWTTPGNYPVEAVWVANGQKHVQIGLFVKPCIGGNNGEKLTFIEGIGTNIGVFYQETNAIFLNGCPYLLCSHKDGSIEFLNSTHPVYAGMCQYLKTEDFNIEKETKIYPNPTPDVFKVKSHKNLFINQVTIYDVLGNKLETFKPKPSYNISNLQNGTYFVKIGTNRGSSVKQIIKE